MTDDDKRRLAKFILNTWALGEELNEQLKIEGENLDPSSEYEVREHHENKRVLYENWAKAEAVLAQLEELVMLALS